MTVDELQRVLDWANEKLATGAEPPWAWFQYMKLRETLETIIASSSSATLQTESSQQLVQQRGNVLRLVVSADLKDSVQPHSDAQPVPLPM